MKQNVHDFVDPSAVYLYTIPCDARQRARGSVELVFFGFRSANIVFNRRSRNILPGNSSVVSAIVAPWGDYPVLECEMPQGALPPT